MRSRQPELGPATHLAVGRGDTRPVVLHYCQHSVGMGHLVRSLAIAAVLAQRYRVVLCSGGRVPDEIAIPPGVELIALPPVGSGPDGALVSQDPATSLGEALAARGRLLLDTFTAIDPDVLLIELFPLGRRGFASELIPLLKRARGTRHRQVVCSVRDLLVSGHPDQQRHDDEAAGRLNAFFDAVIVHGDPGFARLEESFRPRIPVRVPVLYSGFVTARTAPPLALGHRADQIVVSAGGGLVGDELFRAAAEAHRSRLAPGGLATRIITGPFLPAADFDRLREQAAGTEGLTVERFVPDLCAVMASCAVSVSQCGYNTAIDLLLSGTPAVVVPYGEGRESEQRDRARRLAGLGVVRVLPPARLSAAALAEEVLRLAKSPARPPAAALGGAARTAALVGSLLEPPVAELAAGPAR